MRLRVSLRPADGHGRPNKHAVQGFIYNMLRGTGYGSRHDEPRFKFFTFSDLFFDSKRRLTFIISSPDGRFIDALYSSMREHPRVFMGKEELEVVELKAFKLSPRRAFQTGSPIVIYKNAQRGEYFKLHEHRDLRFFLDRLKENAEKKYNAFYGDSLHLEGPIFDKVLPKVRRNGKLDVYVKVVKEGRPFPVIGSNWEILWKDRLEPHECKFYRFIMDAGLGEKNSLGFGFLNPIRR